MDFEYRAMWIFAMFDLPVKTKAQRREYTTFRKALLREGFQQLQYSVYARFCGGQAEGDAQAARVARSLPPSGHVRTLFVTDRQFAKMQVFDAREPRDTDPPPEQLLLF